MGTKSIAMTFAYIKALHIIFVVTWFAGLFYIIRLFIYHTEALEKKEPERSILTNQMKLMSSRLWYIITWPSAILNLVVGLWVLWLQSWHLDFTYMWIKLALVLLLYGYHFYCHWLFLRLQKGIGDLTSTQLRILNEVATILLIGIVFLIVVRTSLSLLWGLGAMVVLMVVFMIIVKAYKNYREKKEKKNENTVLD